MDAEYLQGSSNYFIRMYFYLSNGLGIVNEFRNLFLGIFGLYFTLKLENPVIMVFLFIGSVVVLIPVGHYMVHKVSKVKEWLATKFGSHYAIKNFDYTKEQNELLKEILIELRKQK